MAEKQAEMSPGARLIGTMRTIPAGSTTEVLEPINNPFSDEDCAEVFRWLVSGDDVNPPGDIFPRSVASIALTRAHMGDAGFRALVTWLESLNSLRHDIDPGNRLRFLNFQHNEIVGNRDLAHAFVSSLSFSNPRSSTPSSWISQLILSNNPLSTSFKATLISLLPTLSSLRHLGLSATGLTKDDALALALYIRNETHPCRLTELHINANHIGYRGLRAVIVALERCWTMEKVETRPNDIGEPPNPEEMEEINATKEGDGADRTLVGWEGLARFSSMAGLGSAMPGMGPASIGSAILHEALEKVLTRNTSAKRNVIKEALLLLKYSRLMLQKKMKLDLQPQQQELTPIIPEAQTNNSFSFTHLPTEVQLGILSSLAPTLSPAQCIQVFKYAVDPSTLPSLHLPQGLQTTQKEWAASVECDAFDPAA